MSTSDTPFTDPYQASPADAQPSWLGGPDAVNVTAETSAAPAPFEDPYQAAPAEAHPDWLNGPDAVSNDLTAQSLQGASDSLTAASQTSTASAHSFSDSTQSMAGWFDGSLPVQDWVNQGLNWFVGNFRPAFQALRQPVDALLGGVEAALQYPPPLVMIGLLSLLAWQLAGARMAVGTLVSLMLIGLLGIWSEAMITLSLVLTALFFCVLIGLPLGIWLARSDRANRMMRPLLDAMQTTPAFVYLVPVVMLFGIGNVPGVMVTIIFALPPLVRLTNLGIRQVRPDLVEATQSYGASPWQLLTRVQLPLAMPSIMAGINQSLMLSLSMVVIASMIAVGGLGLMVLRGIGRLDMGLATVGGLGIVILAIVLDRLTQALSQPQRHGQPWHQRGPIGLVKGLLGNASKSGESRTNAIPAPAVGVPRSA